MSDGGELPTSMNREDDGSVIGFMCMIDWEFELGAACGGNRIYPSLDDLKQNHPCWKACGVAEVEVRIKSVAVPSKEDYGA